MSRRRTFTRRAALGLFALSTAPCLSSPRLAAHIRQQHDRKLPAEILTLVFSRTWQQRPFYDDCHDLADDKCLEAVLTNTEALYRAGYSEDYIQDQLNRNVSILICKDFQESNVRGINGWILSRTEAAICALINEEIKAKANRPTAASLGYRS
jgi:hypothetical protein